jgi:hypothetical protein
MTLKGKAMSVVIWDGKTLSSDTRAWVETDFTKVGLYTKDEATKIKKLLSLSNVNHDYSLLRSYHAQSDVCNKILIRPGLLADGLKVKAFACVGSLEIYDIVKGLPNGTDLTDYINSPLRKFDGKILLVTDLNLTTITLTDNSFRVATGPKNTVFSMGAGVLPKLPYEPGFMTSEELVRVSCYMSTAQGGSLVTWPGKGRSLTTSPMGDLDLNLIKKYFDYVKTLELDN